MVGAPRLERGTLSLEDGVRGLPKIAKGSQGVLSTAENVRFSPLRSGQDCPCLRTELNSSHYTFHYMHLASPFNGNPFTSFQSRATLTGLCPSRRSRPSHAKTDPPHRLFAPDGTREGWKRPAPGRAGSIQVKTGSGGSGFWGWARMWSRERCAWPRLHWGS